MQVLVARLSFDDKDLHLRPKVADVVRRATGFAPDDAFVQWTAAETGRYWSSQCGPVEYPEAAVAAIARLEPDNAAAISYSVALAQVKGDARAVDDALARMAASRRADDHRGEEIAAWRAVYLAHPDDGIDSDADASVRDLDALNGALMHATLSSSASAALTDACKPDARSDTPWQRLGNCVDAGLLLARKGNSVALRDDGLAMLTAAGATRADLADLERDLEWLKAKSANSIQNYEAAEDEPQDIAADWNGAPSEIEATARRLARLGLPSTPPTGWVSARDLEEETENAQQAAWASYVRGLVDAMRNGSDLHEKALALSSEVVLSWIPGSKDAETPTRAGNERAALVALAADHRDDVLVNWIAAGYNADGAEPDAATLANLQRIDADNGATWALSFGAPDADADAILGRMASTRTWDEHYIDMLGLWNRAIARHGVTDDLAKSIESQAPWSDRALTSDEARATMAVMFATASSVGAVRYPALISACADATGERRTACIGVARRMFESRALLTVRFGALMLRKLDALDDDERARDRQLAWWTQNTMSIAGASARYVDDALASKSEIEAIRMSMQRASKLDPPADWKAPSGILSD
jgi:hypothetical protein